MAKKKRKLLRSSTGPDYARPARHLRIEKVNWLDSTGRDESTGIRIYCTSSIEHHESWALQVRGPMTLANGRVGHDFIIATATLDADSLRGLRDAITEHLRLVHR